jgi:hypothetical protein
MYHHRVDVLLRDVYRETDAAVVWESWRFPKAKRGFWEGEQQTVHQNDVHQNDVLTNDVLTNDVTLPQL